MKHTIILIVISILSFGSGFLFSKTLAYPSTTKSKQLLLTCSQTLASLQKQEKAKLLLNATQLEKSVKETVSQAKPGLVTYSYTQTPLSDTEIKVDIAITGDERTFMDGADLDLIFDNQAEIKEIIKGAAFASYPRLSLSKNHITITGVAGFKNNSIEFGKPGLFASIIVKKNSPSIKLTVVQENTKVFFQNKSILDLKNSFSDISL